EALPQREAIVLAAELETDDAEARSQQAGEWAEQFVAARQAGDQHQRRPLAPFSVIDAVVAQMGVSGPPRASGEFGAGGGQPCGGCLHASSPLAVRPAMTCLLCESFARSCWGWN